MRIAYADPPYPGTARIYGRREVLHDRLFAALERFDGWALSTSTGKLHEVLPLAPKGARVAAFVKKGRSGPFLNASSWEPVIYRPARANWTMDSVVTSRAPKASVPDCVPSRAGKGILRTRGCIVGAGWGVKPPEFCGWLFELLGAEPADAFFDLFKGSGAVSRAWSQWCAAAPAGPLFAKGR